MRRYVMMVILVGVFCGSFAYAQTVSIPDPVLRAAIEAELGIEDPNASEMLGITALNPSDHGITNLTGLEFAANLGFLRLSFRNNQIGDLSPLAGLTSLTRLHLDKCQISSIAALSGLWRLEELALQGNHVSDLSALSGLTNLRVLWLVANQITDVSPLSGLANLTELTLDGNQISKVSALSGLWRLEFLSLNSNHIGDLSPLSGLTNLTQLNLTKNPLNQEACDVVIPHIIANNPSLSLYPDLLRYDPCVQYALTISSSKDGSVTTPGEGRYLYAGGTSVPVTATPEGNHSFKNWTGTAVTAGKVVDANSESTSVTMHGDYTLVANFELIVGACCNTATGACYLTDSGECFTGFTYLGDNTTCSDCQIQNISKDFGDAPATYPVMNSNNGASHLVQPDIYLGVGVSAEADGQPGNLDTFDDGVQFAPSIVAGEDAVAIITASKLGVINGWLDLNRDGDWADLGEHILVDEPVISGENYISYHVPSTATRGESFLRIRYNSIGGLSYDGPAVDGEVEDYCVTISDDAGNVKNVLCVDANAIDSPRQDGTANNPFASIQQAINAASTGEVVVVFPGQYVESLDFLGKAIHVTSLALVAPEVLAFLGEPNSLGAIDKTVIHGNYNGAVVTFSNGEDTNTVLSGFTITGGRDRSGGAILCYNSAPVIRNCVITGNRATLWFGGAVDSFGSHATFINCTIVDNYSHDINGAAVTCENSNDVFINCILWGNSPAQIVVISGDNPLVQYCDIQGRTWPGTGNISKDPYFALPGTWTDASDSEAHYVPGDYHLQSHAGRYESNSDNWTVDAHMSPCIDLGDPNRPFELESDPNGLRVNAGAYGGTRDASRSEPGSVVLYQQSLDTDPGWTTQGEWAYGVPVGLGGANGHPDPASGHTGEAVYGVNLAGDHDSSIGGPHAVTFGPLDCTGYVDIRLTFWRWLNTDIMPYVRNAVEYSVDGNTWAVLWENAGPDPTTDSQWTPVSLNLSPGADGKQEVYLRWTYDIQGRAYQYSGWNIDDIRVTGEHGL